jgi:hypothetical protein
VLAAWAKSGESCAAFARRRGLVPQRLLWWRQRLAASQEPSSTQTNAELTRFVPVTVAVREARREATESAVVVTVGDEIRIEVREVDASTAAWVAQLVSTLAREPA